MLPDASRLHCPGNRWQAGDDKAAAKVEEQPGINIICLVIRRRADAGDCCPIFVEAVGQEETSLQHPPKHPPNRRRALQVS